MTHSAATFAGTSSPARPALARTGPWKGFGGPDLLLEEYWPRSTLRLPAHEVRRVRFPVISGSLEGAARQGKP